MASGGARQINADLEGAVSNGADAMDKQGHTGDAVEFLLMGESLMPQEPQFLFQWASYEAKLGNLDGAKFQIGKLIDVAPEWRVKVLEDPAFKSMWD